MNNKSDIAINVQVNFTIVGATNLPQTDLLSDIDAYIIFKPSQNSPQIKTIVIDNNPNPKWNTQFTCYFPFDSTNNCFDPIIFELWDDNVVSEDEKVATAEFQILPSHFNNTIDGIVHIPFIFKKQKYNKLKSELIIKLQNCIYSCESVYNIMRRKIEGCRYEKMSYGRLYIPLNFNSLALGLEYNRDSITIKIFVTDPNELLHIIPERKGEKILEYTRRRAIAPFEVLEGVDTFEHVKLHNIPFSQACESGRISFVIFEKELASQLSLSEIVTSHGWEGKMNYHSASEILKEVELNPKAKQVYIKQEDSFIAIHFASESVDLQCIELEGAIHKNETYDFTYMGSEIKQKFNLYNPTKPLAFLSNGNYLTRSNMELVDFPGGAYFSEMLWNKYKLSERKEFNLLDIVQLRPF